MDCDARIREAARANFRLTPRAGGAEKDSRMYNLPGDREVECVIAAATEGPPRDIAIGRKGGSLWPINESHPYYYPLAYDLMHPSGEHGWRYAIPHTRPDGKATAQKFAS